MVIWKLLKNIFPHEDTQTLGLPGFTLKGEHATKPIFYLNNKQARKGGFFSKVYSCPFKEMIPGARVAVLAALLILVWKIFSQCQQSALHILLSEMEVGLKLAYGQEVVATLEQMPFEIKSKH